MIEKINPAPELTKKQIARLSDEAFMDYVDDSLAYSESKVPEERECTIEEYKTGILNKVVKAARDEYNAIDKHNQKS